MQGTALLVDGDNVPPQLLGPLIAFLERDGPVTERRIFRNWRSTKDTLNWDAAAKRHAFERIDRYKTTEGKNASDVAVVVTAMDFFHAGMRRFCIASGDTDFSPLVERLRRGGSHVVVVGHKVEGGLLADLADVYIDWKALVPGARDGPRDAARSAHPARAPAASRTASHPRTPPPPALPRNAVRETRAKAGRGRGPIAERGSRAHSPAKRARKQAREESGAAAGDRPHARLSSRPAQPARPPPRAASAADGLARLHALLLDAYESARTDGEVDPLGWVAVDRLGQIARGLDPAFTPARYGLGSRTTFTSIFQRATDLFEVQAMGRSGNRQYKVRRL
ncbi:MAG TPA: NYN domain-containing protein [Candidatus Thermoplasmatota archaeon]|nr:NYN domain-containing protein [Candidatus Thermoplasmatota archaeon]